MKSHPNGGRSPSTLALLREAISNKQLIGFAPIYIDWEPHRSMSSCYLARRSESTHQTVGRFNEYHQALYRWRERRWQAPIFRRLLLWPACNNLQGSGRYCAIGTSSCTSADRRLISGQASYYVNVELFYLLQDLLTDFELPVTPNAGFSDVWDVG